MVKKARLEVPVPPAMQHLPLTPNGYHKPWFVKAKDLREINDKKYVESMKKGRCWICGGANKKEFVFVTDAKAAFHCVSLEPPCHEACAEYAAKVCPFLILPKAKRRTAGLPEPLIENAVPEMEQHNTGYYVLTYVKRFQFTRVTETKMAKWDDKYVVRQVLWSAASVVAEEAGPLRKDILKSAVPADEQF